MSINSVDLILMEILQVEYIIMILGNTPGGSHAIYYRMGKPLGSIIFTVFYLYNLSYLPYLL